MQQEASASDSDICSECSTSDSDIPDEKEAGNAKSAAACETNVQSDSSARRQPTLVQHAAAATIQRRFRQQLRTRQQDCNRNMQPCSGQNSWSTSSPVKVIAEAPTQQQHEAASCIQAWWRRQSTITRVQMAAPSTPPCSNMQISFTSKHSSRPDSASSSSQTGGHGIAHLLFPRSLVVEGAMADGMQTERRMCITSLLQAGQVLNVGFSTKQLLLECDFRQAGCCRIQCKH